MKNSTLRKIYEQTSKLVDRLCEEAKTYVNHLKNIEDEKDLKKPYESLKNLIIFLEALEAQEKLFAEEHSRQTKSTKLTYYLPKEALESNFKLLLNKLHESDSPYSYVIMEEVANVLKEKLLNFSEHLDYMKKELMEKKGNYNTENFVIVTKDLGFRFGLLLTLLQEWLEIDIHYRKIKEKENGKPKSTFYH